MARGTQLDLLNPQRLPAGFKYHRDAITPEQEQELLRQIATLPFKAFEFRGFEGKRRVVSYGWRYDFTDQQLLPADPIPAFLLPIRDLAASFADLPSDRFEQVSVLEYSPGSAIGWHTDRPMFDDVVGLSLLSACRFRFRREVDDTWERAAIIAEPRSIYLLRGPSRTEWQHSIPAVDTLRYSITLRSFRPQ